MGDDPLTRIFVLLSGIASAAMVLAVYHFLNVGWNRCRSHSSDQEEEEVELPSTTFGLTSAMVQLLPSYKYDKEAGVIGDDGICAVCLSEFEEGQEVRTLPECVHSFHVPCIDMWLASHCSCPLCRTDTTPPHSVTMLPLANSNGMRPFHDLTPNTVV